MQWCSIQQCGLRLGRRAVDEQADQALHGHEGFGCNGAPFSLKADQALRLDLFAHDDRGFGDATFGLLDPDLIRKSLVCARNGNHDSQAMGNGVEIGS